MRRNVEVFMSCFSAVNHFLDDEKGKGVSRGRTAGGISRFPTSPKPIIQRKAAGAEDENEQRGEEEGVGIGSVEFAGIGEDRGEGIAGSQDVGADHVAGEQQAEHAAAETE